MLITIDSDVVDIVDLGSCLLPAYQESLQSLPIV
jgi:hypothetical protein